MTESRPGNYCWYPGCEQIAYDHECPDHRRDDDDAEPKSLREWWFGGSLKFHKHPIHWLVWLLDEGLDRIPSYEDGRWYSKGGWGCRLGLHQFWDGPARRAAATEKGEVERPETDL